MGGVHLWEVSAYGRCPRMAGVRLWEVSTYGRCPLMGGVHLWEVSTYGKCPLMGGVHVWQVSAYGRCPLMGGVRLWEVSTYGRCPLMGGVHLWEVSAYGRRPLMGGAHLWEVSTYGRCPLMGGVHLWEVSGANGRRPLMGGAHLWEVSAYGRCPLMGGVHLWEMNKDAALEAISLENLTWSQEEFSLSDYVDKFPLPQIVKGYYSINGDNVCVNPGDKLKLIRVVSGQSEDYLVVETQDGSGFPLRIPLSASAGFQPLNDGREYYLQEAINENSMPFFFQFINPRNLNATGEASVFNSALGVLRAEKTYRDSSVICTTMEEGTTRTVVTCPKNLEITVTAASGALIGDKDYMRVCRFFHDGVSLKRIENMECFNVFASRETIREYLYDTPKTQDEDIPQYEYTEPSNDDDEHEYTYISDEDLSTFQRFDYEKFKSSFVEVKTDPEEEARKDEEEDTDEYEDMQLPEQTKDDQSSAKPVIYLQKPTPPPVKPKPVVKVQGTHHIMENNDSRQKSASESEEKPMPDPVSKMVQ
ncbi:hypothetical protein QZH41_001166 [Actinostola sp. cb2023]|nr:hypothetical protein QZH41_001166 [Actinostola sp. cb2023]